MKRLRAFLYSKSFNIVFSTIINVVASVLITYYFGIAWYMIGCLGFATLIFLGLIYKNRNCKTNFMILQLSIILPLVALTLFRYMTNIRGSKRIRTKYRELSQLDTGYTASENDAVLDTLSKKSILISKTSKYLNATLNAPVYENNSAYFISSADKYYEDLSRSLKGAKKYIFIECNKMTDCAVWQNIFQILKERTFVGVEVKLLYDDYNSIKAFKDKETFVKLFNHKIETLAFNPLKAGVGGLSQHRNFNNTIIIDGECAYAGQIGLSNEFVEKSSLGDVPNKKLASAIYVSGDAVISLTKNFVINWNLFASSDALVLEKYLTKGASKSRNKNYIQPFEVTPLIKENVCKNIQNNLVNCASNSLWIVTPYMLVGSESKNALIASARCGVDVNIIVSKNYKSKWQNDLSYTNYGSLIREGVKIYTIDNTELENQIILADNSNLLIGTGNIDSRRMYSPFENGMLVYSEDIAVSVQQYIAKLLPYCTQLTYKEVKKRKLSSKLNGALLKIFSPLM